MTNINDIKKPSRFLSQLDCEPPILLTITGCKWDNVAPANAKSEEKVVLTFQENPKPLVLNVTNYNIVRKITGKDEIEDWVGTQVVAYVNPDVEYQGEIIGGVRLREPKSQQPKKESVPF